MKSHSAFQWNLLILHVQICQIIYFSQWILCKLRFYCWVLVLNIFYFHPYLGKIPLLTN